MKATISSRRALLAVNVDTGKMAWYFQTSPHDTHDWDSTQTPILADAMFDGRMRKLVHDGDAQRLLLRARSHDRRASRDVEVRSDQQLGGGLDSKGQPKRNPHKDATIAGSLVNSSVTNYPPPTFSPETGLFYVHEANTMRISYLMEPDPRGSMGLGGTSGGGEFVAGPRTSSRSTTGPGRSSGASRSTAAASGCSRRPAACCSLSNGQNVEAWDAATGKGLWYSQIGGLQSPPETFMLDGKQHMLFSAGGSLLHVRVELRHDDGVEGGDSPSF